MHPPAEEVIFEKKVGHRAVRVERVHDRSPFRVVYRLETPDGHHYKTFPPSYLSTEKIALDNAERWVSYVRAW